MHDDHHMISVMNSAQVAHMTQW